MRSYRFAAPVLQMESGMRFHYLPIPEDATRQMLEEGVRRVVGTLNGTEVNRGLVGDGEGGRILIVGLALLREIGAEHGDMVECVLQPDPHPDRVELGEEFEAVLDMDEEAAERFQNMTPGKQRGMAYYVNSAKREETRIKRALEIARKLRTRTLYSDRQDG